MKESELITDLTNRIQKTIEEAEAMKALPNATLNFKPADDKWSVLECFEHLNLYGDFYLPEFEKRILSAPQDTKDHNFKSGWFGERTVQSMIPKDGAVKKMNAFKSKNPAGSELSVAVISRFIKQQQQLIALLEQAKNVNLSKTKTDTTLPVIRFKLGTTLRFVIYHAQRHIWQANNVLAELK